MAKIKAHRGCVVCKHFKKQDPNIYTLSIFSRAHMNGDVCLITGENISPTGSDECLLDDLYTTMWRKNRGQQIREYMGESYDIEEDNSDDSLYPDVR